MSNPTPSAAEAAEAYAEDRAIALEMCDFKMLKPGHMKVDTTKFVTGFMEGHAHALASPEVLALVEALQKSYELLRQRDVCLSDRNKALGWMHTALAAFELAKGGK